MPSLFLYAFITFIAVYLKRCQPKLDLRQDPLNLLNFNDMSRVSQFAGTIGVIYAALIGHALPRRHETEGRSVIIACATDQAFVQPTCVMLASLARSGGVERVPVFVFGLGLRPSDHKKIRASYSCYPSKLTICDLASSAHLIRRMPVTRFVPSVATYARLLIPDLLDKKFVRLLYLDVDTIVNCDISKLFEMELEERIIAAVQDQGCDVKTHEYRSKVLNMTNPSAYFNAGMMIVDLVAWRKNNIAGQAFALYSTLSVENDLACGDQDLLNSILQDRWLEIDRRWNFFQGELEPPFLVEDYEKAKIIHFASPNKPWFSRCCHPAKQLYLNYRLMTPFANARLYSDFEKKFHIIRRTPRQALKELITRIVNRQNY